MAPHVSVPRRVAAPVFAVLASLAVFAVLADEAFEGERLGWDVAIENFLFRWVPEAHADGAARGAVVFAFIALLVLVPSYLARRGRLREAAFWVICFGALDAFGLARVLAGADPGEYAFPSAGAMLFGALAAASAPLLADRRIRHVAVAAACAGAAVHGIVVVDARLSHPSAVLAGWLAAVAWVTAVRLVVLPAPPTRALLRPVPAARAAVAEPRAAEGLLETNLFLSFGDLSQRLLRLSAAESQNDRDATLDAFLLAAGMNQILEDDLQRDFLSLWRASAHLPRPAASFARGAARVGFALRELTPQARRLQARRDRLAEVLATLAELVADASVLPGHLEARAQAALLPASAFPSRLRRGVQRLPNCYRSFDQQPADSRLLVERFAQDWPDRARPVLVVGLRTSGNYLAPLHAAFLRAAGYSDVRVLTLRPGKLLGGAERRAIARAARDGAVAVVVDDPPRTGRQLSEAASELGSRGLEDVVLLLQLPGEESDVPAALDEHTVIALGGRDWSIRERLHVHSVERALDELLDVERVEVDSVELLPPRRGHVGARVDARLQEQDSSHEVEASFYVEGVGLGYFGRHAEAVARRLEHHVAPVHGVRDGLLFRAWLPERARLTPAALRSSPDSAAAAIAGYVHLRSRLLRLDDDVSLRLGGREAAWEHIATMLGDAFGLLKQFVRPVTHRVARQLLEVDEASVADSATAPWSWFVDGNGLLRKTGFEQRASTNTGFQSCDPAFDLAEAAAAAESSGAREFEARVRLQYELLTGTPVDEERWLLYRILHHLGAYRSALGAARSDPAALGRALELERAMAETYARYFEHTFFWDLAPSTGGPLAALDLDGVLETRWTEFPALSPASAQALRSLTLHGYRPVIVSGRSLAEVRFRCSAYRLAGGVAEYGSVLYVHGSGLVRSLVPADDASALEQLRAFFASDAGLLVDAAYRHSVRIHALTSDGARRGLHAEEIDEAIARAGVVGRVRAVAGGLQTDFVGVGVDKGRGLGELAGELGAERDRRPDVALAIGDQESDLPMLALADRAFAPANASERVAARVEAAGASYGAGVLEATRAVLGHRRCPLCRPPAAGSRESRLLLTALGALDGGKRSKLVRAAALAAELSRV